MQSFRSTAGCASAVDLERGPSPSAAHADAERPAGTYLDQKPPPAQDLRVAGGLLRELLRAIHGSREEFRVHLVEADVHSRALAAPRGRGPLERVQIIE